MAKKTEKATRDTNPALDSLIIAKLEDIDYKITTFINTRDARTLHELEGSTQYIEPQQVLRTLPPIQNDVDNNIWQQHVQQDGKAESKLWEAKASHIPGLAIICVFLLLVLSLLLYPTRSLGVHNKTTDSGRWGVGSVW